MVSFSSFAQTPESAPSCTAQECAAPQNCTKAPAGARKAKAPKADPFAGLTLTDAQKDQLQQLREKRATARADKQQARKSDIRRNDSTRVADRKQYLEEVKEIIGPDQYVMYLENIVINGPQSHHRHSKAFGKTNQHCKSFSKAGKINKAAKANRHEKHAARKTEATPAN